MGLEAIGEMIGISLVYLLAFILGFYTFKKLFKKQEERKSY